MIEEIIKELLDLLEVYVKADMIQDEIYYHIYFTDKMSYPFEYVKRVEEIARMNKYELYVNNDGFDLYPKGF
jgi:hypothetical protein